MEHYFKYKSLSGESFNYFIQMLINCKMYPACFKKLNDPMEGAYLSHEVAKGYMNQKEEKRIISLVKKNSDEKPCNMLMWSHYSDEHRGCCIEFHFMNEEDEEKIRSVNYIDKIENDDVHSIEDVLTRKFVDWKYEHEVRHLGTETYVPIVIDRIYLGMRVDDMYNEEAESNESFYRELLKRLCPKVEVVKMCAEDFDNHHIDTHKEYINVLLGCITN